MLDIAPVAQLDRALPSEGRGHRFESCRVHHFSYIYQQSNTPLILQCSKVLTLLQSVVKFYIESIIAQVARADRWDWHIHRQDQNLIIGSLGTADQLINKFLRLINI